MVLILKLAAQADELGSAELVQMFFLDSETQKGLCGYSLTASGLFKFKGLNKPNTMETTRSDFVQLITTTYSQRFFPWSVSSFLTLKDIYHFNLSYATS